MNLANWLERTALRHPNKKALFHGTKCLGTYKDLWIATCSFRSQLEKAGVKSDARVAVFMHNCPEYLVAFRMQTTIHLASGGSYLRVDTVIHYIWVDGSGHNCAVIKLDFQQS